MSPQSRLAGFGMKRNFVNIKQGSKRGKQSWKNKVK